MTKIFTVIVTYNGIKWIEECLDSIRNSSIPVSIIVVDNNSTDQTTALIKNKFKEVILLEQKENLGFGKGNNLGINYALDNNADYVFLLNQDAFVEVSTIEKLITVSKEQPEYGILSPIQLEYSGKLLEYYFYNFMTEDQTRSFYSDPILKNNANKIYDIHFIQAAAWLLPKNTLKIVGGFDPIFDHYGEDNNYCQRVLYHKLKIGVAANSFIRHDSHKQIIEIPLFSEKHFQNYQREIYCKYANINRSFGQKEINNELKKNYAFLLKNLIKFNFKNTSGYLRQANLFKSKIDLINLSREKNKEGNFNYLKIG